ncbi:MAG: hypothetical protein AAF468_18590 [Pseudomonadota bacterium]
MKKLMVTIAGTLLAASALSNASAAECKRGDGVFTKNMKVCGCPTMSQIPKGKTRWHIQSQEYQCQDGGNWAEGGQCLDVKLNSFDSAIELIRAFSAEDSKACY